MNDRSSRAHTVLVLQLTQVNQMTGAVVQSQLHLVDLAGCEQLKQSKAIGARKVEAVGINRSLLVLGMCISALVKQQQHVPYLDAKLTTLLRGIVLCHVHRGSSQCGVVGALGGNSRTDEEHADQVHTECTLSAY